MATDETLIYLTLCIILGVLLLSITILFLFLNSKSKKLIIEKDNDAEVVRARWVKAEKTAEKSASENERLSKQVSEMTSRFQAIVDVDAEKNKVLKEIDDLHGIKFEFEQRYNREYKEKADEATKIQAAVAELQKEYALLDENSTLQSFGFYKPRYGFESSSQYQLALDRIRTKQKSMITAKSAAICTTQWTVNNSIVEGRKQINQTLKLILRAFNGESDAAIAKVKYNNVKVMEARIFKAYEALNKLVSVQQCSLAYEYLNSKLEELYLVHEYQEKIQEEKEEQRRIREQMREEEVARREIEKALHDSEREETRYAEALRKAREEVEKSVGEKQAKFIAQIEFLEQKLAEAQANKERAISRAQMTRSGHVYVISNIGSFGENIYKIGMTRRLDPMDRVHELGDASVPFKFDVHAIIYSEDAPTLENQIHRKFHDLRINQVNYRKEFFRVTLDEIAAAVKEFHGEIEFTLLADAPEYRKTVAFLNERRESNHTLNVENSLEI